MSSAPIHPVNIERTYGALLVGGFIAIGFSGIVTAQTFVYYTLYRRDVSKLKLLVGGIWMLDVFHTGFICASIWDYVIKHFGDVSRIDFIPRTLPVTIILTASLTFPVHMFFVHRIYRLTKNNIFICLPIAVLAFLRLCSACVTSSEMLVLQHFSLFIKDFRWVFTLGLGLSSTVDVLITTALCYYLETSRTGSISLNHVINALMLYTFENGALTCIATIVSMICWLTMPHNLIFMGIHFVISKLYANSLLVALNTRKRISRGKGSVSSIERSNTGLPVLTSANFGGRGHGRNLSAKSPPPSSSGKSFVPLQINIAKTVEYDKSDQEVTFIGVEGLEGESVSRPSTARTLKFEISEYAAERKSLEAPQP